MSARLWFMNADFEAELASRGPYRRKPTIARRNRRLAPALLWLAADGDALLLDRPWSPREVEAAARRHVELAAPESGSNHSARTFSPWGWTASAVEVGLAEGAIVDAVAGDVVARVNSKVFSHHLERELGVAMPGTGLATTMVELDALAARACPGADDKWVVKAAFGFAARERVLGRGPRLDAPSALWAARRFARGDVLLFEPWLDVELEVGVQLDVRRDGTAAVVGLSHMTTNGAGVTTGFIIGDSVRTDLALDLTRFGAVVGARLSAEGYWGPANVDALVHRDGVRHLLEINARHTMGLVALAVEREIAPSHPRVWTPLEY